VPFLAPRETGGEVTMSRVTHWPVIVLLPFLLSLTAGGAAGEPRERGAGSDVYTLYRRMTPGMSAQAVEALAEHATRLTLDESVATWLLWQHHSDPGRGTEVLRASFRDGRLARIEYESFGDEYRHLVKGDRTVPMDAGEVARLWRRAAQVDQAADSCHEALDAFHQLVLRLQERLTTNEQQEWVRALQLRRVAETQLP
jgi:hypothetical protein